ncbi:MAG: Arc family DNA-binding protein [Chloroflexota bacterium]|nr:Arc family DNA-binding protein [Chloroflexota bacterium]MDE2884892.1 Arc family DNA-binding protein [Chloroflexota bacterium]
MNIALRNVPEDLHAELKAAAKRNHRSLNGEILARLTLSRRLRLGGFTADSEPTAPLNDEEREALLKRIRERQKAIGKVDFDPDMIREMRDSRHP